ncbi:hypothetical protein TIFTF001_023338 [Ficus carica]|uniref:EF-hand domain-containing protein n=1 Tax=Ficus carica TaxID=3494 RepID=A0AA88AK93_FICCA|nr:hypothetical protein TIFTF001_023338 [Ficus carica]
METVMVKFPVSSSIAKILVLVIIELAIVLKDTFSTLRYVVQLSSHFLTFIFCKDSAEFEPRVDYNDLKISDDQVAQTKRDNFPKELCIEEVKDVMDRLVEKNLCDDDDDDDDELFDEEVSMEEVREAFEVFDENKDGFIDAGEVQKVLRALGSMEASVKDCKAMIKAFDKDGDEKIDFKEFVKIMEESFR